MAIKRRSGTKNAPIFSHEFIISNHADIVSCVAMVFVIGLLFQATAPYASMFVAMNHNVTEAQSPTDVVRFSYGIKDTCMIFFYYLITIVLHAIVQEYLLDKLNRKMHLSKMKHSKFNESGQLLIFYLVSLVCAGDIIFREGYLLNISQLWEGYPHSDMTFIFKFFFIIQIAYWLHNFPELYFQKVKKEEMASRIAYTTLYTVFFTGAYLLNFTPIAICLSFLHYFVESIFHGARLLYFAEKEKLASYGFMIWNGLFVLIRLASITLSVLTFWYGLALKDSPDGVDFVKGQFNTKLIRLNCLIAICILQAWMMWNFISFHLKRMRERAALLATTTKKKTIPRKEKKPKKDKEELKKAAAASAEEDELPEVDQNFTKKEIKSKQPISSTASPKNKKNK